MLLLLASSLAVNFNLLPSWLLLLLVVALCLALKTAPKLERDRLRSIPASATLRLALIDFVEFSR